jgi:hypothetical protein
MVTPGRETRENSPVSRQRRPGRKASGNAWIGIAISANHLFCPFVAAADQASADSDEIVVVGDKKRDVDLRIVAGRAFLKGCASLTYDMQKRTLGLRC